MRILTLLACAALLLGTATEAVAQAKPLQQPRYELVTTASREIATHDEYLVAAIPVADMIDLSIQVTTACTGTSAGSWYICGLDGSVLPPSLPATTFTTFAIESSFAAKQTISANGLQDVVSITGIWPCEYLGVMAVFSNPPTELVTVTVTHRARRFGK
jgi:hypothetical protein